MGNGPIKGTYDQVKGKLRTEVIGSILSETKIYSTLPPTYIFFSTLFFYRF